MDQNATYSIVSLLYSGSEEAVYGCLIGLGHWQLADRLNQASRDFDYFNRAIDDLPTRPVSDADGEFVVAFFSEVAIDAGREARLLDQRRDARNRWDAARSEIRRIAEALDPGFDFSPA